MQTISKLAILRCTIWAINMQLWQPGCEHEIDSAQAEDGTGLFQIQLKSIHLFYGRQTRLNLMNSTPRLVKMNVLSSIEPIIEGVRKNSLICKFVHGVTFSKTFHNWLNK